MTQFEIDSFGTASGGGGGVVSGAYQLSGIYQPSGDFAFTFVKQISGLYVTFSGGMYAASGTAGGASVVSGSLQLSGLYVTHSGGLYQASGIFQNSGVFLNSGAFQISGIYPTSGLFSLSGAGGAAGGVSGVIHGSIFTGSGNSSTVLYTLSHGIGSVPSTIVVAAGSPLARSTVDVSGNASGIFVTYPIAPSSGTVRLHWMAGPSNIAIIGSVGSGSVHAGTFLGSGNGTTTLYTLSHGLGVAPQGISVEPASPHARGVIDVSGDASGIYVTFPVAPASGDVRLTWIAGPSTIATLASGAWQTSGVFQISGAFQLSGVFALSGVGAGVSGVVHAATFLGSGDNSNLVYTLSHGLGITPVGISVEPSSPQARGSFDVSGNASGIFVRYPVPPVSGDVKLSWIAGPTDAANIVTIGSGTVHAATFAGSGNASTTVYTLSHGIGAVPQGLVVAAMSPQARGDFDVSGNASGIFVTYPIAPASGSVKLSWLAGPSTLVAISGNLVHGAEFIGSGNNSTTVYTLSHGLGNAPNTMTVVAGSPQARGNVDVSGNASGIIVTYTSPPASGTVRLFWQAGPTSIATLNAQSGIYTITSGSSINGVISGSQVWTGSSDFSGDTTFDGPVTFGSAMSGVFFSGLQMLPLVMPCRFVMWVSGSKIQVLNMDNGIIEYSGSSALSGLSYAVQNIGVSTAGSNRAGGIILIRKGGYNLDGTLWIDNASGSTSGKAANIGFVGEGRRSTWITFNTSGTTEGFHIRCDHFTFNNMRISATHSGTIKLIKVLGSSMRSRVENVYFQGAGSAFISGQIAYHIDNSGSVASYYTVHHDNNYLNLHIGIDLQGTHANAQFIDKCEFTTTHIGVRTLSNQNIMSNLYLQGDANTGLACVELAAGGDINALTNIGAETLVSGSAAVILQSGSNNNLIVNPINSNNSLSGYAVRDYHDWSSGANSNTTLIGRRSQVSTINITSALATTATATAANSGAFAPLGFMNIDVSGVTRKVPYFAT